MKRRHFLRGGALAAASAMAAPAIAQGTPEIKWRLTSSFPKSVDIMFGTAQVFAKFVAEATDNKFQIQTFAAGEIVPGLQALDAVSSATADMAHTPLYFYIAKDPTLGFGTGLPFGLNQRHQQAWWAHGGGEAIINEALAPLGVTSLPCGNTGTQMGGFFRKDINTPEDLKGLRFRINGMGAQIVARLGVLPQQIGVSDILAAFERGTIDAAEFIGPYDDERLNLGKFAKNYYYPGWREGSAMMHLIINTEKWAALPKAYQFIVTLATEAAGNWMLAKYDAGNAPALKRLVSAGIAVKPFPAPVLDAAHKAAQDHYADLAEQNPLFKKALDSVNTFRSEQLPWWQVAEHAFDSYMIGVRGRG
jgi:TRAP-type mannitol/chloroaromatic compound transport system substrate-binding protein